MNRDRLRKKCFLFRQLSSQLLEERACPAIFSVSPDSPDGAAGSLRAVISAANNNGQNDLIQLAAGTFELTLAGKYEEGNLTGDLDLTEAGHAVTIRGAGANQTTIDANQLDRVLHVVAGKLVIEDVRITGGAILRDTGTPSTEATWGGGIYAPYVADIHELIRVWLHQNVANVGGGFSGYANIYASTISENQALPAPGNLFGDYAAVSRKGEYIPSRPRIENSTISGNYSFRRGAVHELINVDFSTIVGNMAEDGNAAGLYFSGMRSSVSNSIVAGNTDSLGNPSDFLLLSDLGNNVLGVGERFNPQPSTVITNNPHLGPLQFNGGPTPTHLPLSGSPAINAASPSLFPATDQRGVPRPKGGPPDVGAVELDNVTPAERNEEDVDGNGIVSLNDALLIVQELRRTGPRPTDSDPPSAPYYDTNGDGRLNLSDALEVISYMVHERSTAAEKMESNTNRGAAANQKKASDAHEPLVPHDGDAEHRDALLAEWDDT